MNEPSDPSDPSDPNLPEVEKDLLINILKDLGIFTDHITKPYAVRFIERPNPGTGINLSIEVMTHNRGNMFSPLTIQVILTKFKIKHELFMQAYEAKNSS